MKIPMHDRRPTRLELMEFVDGTLMPQRYHEIEILVSTSRHLQNEVSLLQAMRKTIHHEMTISPSKKFTVNVMNAVFPAKQESFLLRLAKNSSNLFAMTLVLSLVGIVLVSGPKGVENNSNIFAKSIHSYSDAYNFAAENVSNWSKQYTQPVDRVAKTASGKFLFIGLAAFFLFIIADEILGKRYFHTRIKQF